MRVLGITTLVCMALCAVLLFALPDDCPLWLLPMGVAGFTGIPWLGGRYFSHIKP